MLTGAGDISLGVALPEYAEGDTVAFTAYFSPATDLDAVLDYELIGQATSTGTFEVGTDMEQAALNVELPDDLTVGGDYRFNSESRR